MSASDAAPGPVLQYNIDPSPGRHSAMQRTLAPMPRPPHERQPVIRSRANITTACLSCKRRKRKCSGGQPCPACSASKLQCAYDIRLDKRRKGFDRNFKAEMDFQRRLLTELLTAIRSEAAEEVLLLVRKNATLEDLARLLNVKDYRQQHALEKPVDEDSHHLKLGNSPNAPELPSRSIPPFGPIADSGDKSDDKEEQDGTRLGPILPQRVWPPSFQMKRQLSAMEGNSGSPNPFIPSLMKMPSSSTSSMASLPAINKSRRVDLDQMLSHQPDHHYSDPGSPPDTSSFRSITEDTHHRSYYHGLRHE